MAEAEKRWEYLTVVTLSDEQLNRLGQDGWELAGIDMSNRKFFKRSYLYSEASRGHEPVR